ncbi:MAG: nucleotidyltransferase domain-containing protein, partial [Candidatus Methanomethylicaceae archaeon]
MSINKDIIIEALKRSSKKLADTFGDEFVGMILFGSWAREEATIESDVDVLVIFKSLEGFDFRSKVYNMI